MFNFDLKENEAGEPCITEINAGRFCNDHQHPRLDRPPQHGGELCAARLRRRPPAIDDPYDDPGEYYLVRDLDTLPGVFCPPTTCSRASRRL